MYTRRTRVEGAPSTADETATQFEQTALPALKQAAGFQGAVLLVGSSGTGLSVTMWESAEAERASRAAGERARNQIVASNAGMKVVDVEAYEEVLAERSGPAQVGAFTRVNDMQAAPDKLDAGIQFVRDRVIPAVKQQPGFLALLMGVNRENGRAYVSTVWESAAAREASDAAVRDLRREAGELMGGSNVSVGLYEVAFAQLPPIGAQAPAATR